MSTSSGGLLTGAVTFEDGSVPIGISTVTSGMATFTTTTMTVGNHPITAVYSSDPSFSASTSAVLTQTVNQAATSTTLTVSANPSVFGQSVTFTATVSVNGLGAGNPTGLVTFKDAGVSLGTGTLTPTPLPGGEGQVEDSHVHDLRSGGK